MNARQRREAVREEARLTAEDLIRENPTLTAEDLRNLINIRLDIFTFFGISRLAPIHQHGTYQHAQLRWETWHRHYRLQVMKAIERLKK